MHPMVPLTVLAGVNVHLHAHANNALQLIPSAPFVHAVAASPIKMKVCAGAHVISSVLESSAGGLLHMVQALPAQVCISLSVHCPSGPCSGC